MPLRFLGAFGASFAVIAFLVFGLLVSPEEITYQPERTFLGRRASYELGYAHPGAAETKLQIGVNGEGCDALAPSEYLQSICRLAVLLDGVEIAASALGTLNAESSPAREAITWRAVITSDPALCAAGGLIADGRMRCEASARSGSHSTTDGATTVTVRALATN